MSTPRPAPRPDDSPAAGSRTKLAAAIGGAVLLGLWYLSGSLVVAVVVLVALAAAAGLAVVVPAWVRPRPEPLRAPPSDLATQDMTLAPSAADPVRRALRGLLARPWVHGDALLRATATRLDGQDALVWTPRGQQVAAPHLWVEWNPVDAAEVAERRPLESLARELAEGYVEHGGAHGVRRLAERTWVHLLVSDDVPLGRVVVTAAFSEPQRTPVAAACAATVAPLPPAHGARPALPGPDVRPAPAGPRRPNAVSSPVPVARPGRSAPPAGSSPGPASPSPGPARASSSAPPALPTTTVSFPARLRTLVARHASAPVARARLVVLDPAGSRLDDAEVAGPVEVGRDPDADVVIDHPSVSWRHLVLSPGPDGAWTVTDHGSTNGTAVDGRRVHGPTRVDAGAEIALGSDGPRLCLQVPEPTGVVAAAARRAPAAR